MSTRYPGGFINRSAPVIVGPVDGEGGSAPGVWTLEQASYYTKQGTWPQRIKKKPLFGWGGNNFGQVGDGTVTPRSSPVQIGANTTWSNLSSGYSLNGGFATTTSGALYAWGYNNVGQLGQNNTVNQSSPIQVGALTNWSKVFVGSNGQAILSVKTDGTLWGWGRNNQGNLGLTSPLTYLSSPVQIGTDTNWSTCASGDSFSIFIRTTGTMWSAGENSLGKLGLNLALVYRSSPVQIGGDTNWSVVACGANHAIAIKTTGAMWSWGANGQGQLGQNNVIYRSSPVQVGALTNWSSIACGSIFSAAIKTDGTLWTWGRGSSGQLGQNNTVYLSSPTQVGLIATWSSVSCGSNSAMAIQTNKTLWAWGQNDSGQLGQNNDIARSSPVQVGSLSIWSKVTSHGGVSFGIQAI